MCKGGDQTLWLRVAAASAGTFGLGAFQPGGKDAVAPPAHSASESESDLLFLDDHLDDHEGSYAASGPIHRDSPASDDSSCGQPCPWLSTLGEEVAAAASIVTTPFTYASSTSSSCSDDECEAASLRPLLDAAGTLWCRPGNSFHHQVVPLQSGSSSPCSSTCSSCSSHASTTVAVPLLNYATLSGMAVTCSTSAATRMPPVTAPLPAAATRAPKQAATTRAPKQSGGSKKKDINAPKPTNCFLLFCDELRPKIKMQQPELKNQEISRMLGDEWSKLSREQKRKYEDEADRIMAERRRVMGTDYGYARGRSFGGLESSEAKRPRLG